MKFTQLYNLILLNEADTQPKLVDPEDVDRDDVDEDTEFMSPEDSEKLKTALDDGSEQSDEETPAKQDSSDDEQSDDEQSDDEQSDDEQSDDESDEDTEFNTYPDDEDDENTDSDDESDEDDEDDEDDENTDSDDESDDEKESNETKILNTITNKFISYFNDNSKSYLDKLESVGVNTALEDFLTLLTKDQLIDTELRGYIGLNKSSLIQKLHSALTDKLSNNISNKL